jgi:hypothetical protein
MIRVHRRLETNRTTGLQQAKSLLNTLRVVGKLS